jgi:hypothetical protein
MKIIALSAPRSSLLCLRHEDYLSAPRRLFVWLRQEDYCFVCVKKIIAFCLHQEDYMSGCAAQEKLNEDLQPRRHDSRRANDTTYLSCPKATKTNLGKYIVLLAMLRLLAGTAVAELLLPSGGEEKELCLLHRA